MIVFDFSVMQIICPANNIPERTYAITVLFNELMGCGVKCEDIRFDKAVQDYHILTEGKEIVVEDHFFYKYPEPLSYMDLNHVPSTLKWFHAEGLEVPIIYGEDKFEKKEGRVTVGLDVFASIFFMLTRWEESLLGREEKGDCDETELFAVRNEIYQRPIVHEYEELLRRLLLDCGIHFKEREYRVVLTHDVDAMLTPTWGKIIADYFDQKKHGAPENKVLSLTWKSEYYYKKAFPTAFSQFDLYSQLAKKYGVQEWFYFKVCAKGEDEATYCYDDSKVKMVVSKLQKNDKKETVLGFHPSQTTFNNPQQWEEESRRITNLLGEKPTIGRSHHLLYNLATLRMWEKTFATETAPFEISNCVFHKKQGFRSGVSVSYPVFDYQERRQMNLREHPCQIMDVYLRTGAGRCTEEESWQRLTDIMDWVKKYGGELVLTWHMFIRRKIIADDYYNRCEKVLAYACK